MLIPVQTEDGPVYVNPAQIKLVKPGEPGDSLTGIEFMDGTEIFVSDTDVNRLISELNTGLK